MRRPTVSVVMPNYNHARFLPVALQALLDQTWQPFEVIVLDDGSTDNSVEIIEGFSGKSSIIRLLRNDRNRGVAYSANLGVALASGEYLLWAAADDYVLPTFLERSMKLLARYPQAGLCCCDSLALDDKTGSTHEYRAGISERSRYFSPGEVVDLGRSRKFTVGNQTNTVVMKLSALKEIGEQGNCFLPELRSGCDFFPMNIIAFRYGICYFPEALAVFRMTPGSYSTSSRQYTRQICKSMLELLHLDKYRDVLAMFQRSEIFYRFGYHLVVVSLRDRRFRTFLSFDVLMKILSLAMKSIVWGSLPVPVKERYLSFRDKACESFKPHHN